MNYALVVLLASVLSVAPTAHDPIDDLLNINSWPEWTRTYGTSTESAPESTPVEALDVGSMLNLLDSAQPTPDLCRSAEAWNARVHNADVDDWTLTRCADRVADLAVSAAAAEEINGVVTHKEQLMALAESDWVAAEPLLVAFSDRRAPRLSALAIALRYDHTSKSGDDVEELRSALQSIVTDRDRPGDARDVALEALARTEWPGRNDWMASLFSDSTLFECGDANGCRALLSLVETDSDRWIKLVEPLLDSGNRTIHDNAARALVELSNRPDVLRLLLPWIADPHWADGGDERAAVMLAAGASRLLDAVPMLITALIHDDDPGYAAAALETMDVHVNRSVLLSALHHCKDPMQRSMIASAIVFGSDMHPNELAAAIEASLLGRTGDDAMIGSIALTRQDEDVAAAILRRAVKADPATAAKLRDAIVSWMVPSADREKLRRIENGTADVSMIASLLLRREEVRQSLRLDLARIDHGTACGIAAAITGDRIESMKILRGNDVDASRALIAAARLTCEPLPPDDVTRLHSRSAQLDRTIDAWVHRPVR